MRLRHAALVVAALATAASASVLSLVSTAAGVDTLARVATSAWRVDPPAPVDSDPIRRASVELADLVNQFRAQHGLPPLQWHASIALAAQRHGDVLAGRRALSHTGANGTTLAQRLAAVGFGGPAGENLGAGHPTSRSLLAAWSASPAHRSTLLLEFDYIGVGIGVANGVTPYWVLVIAADDWDVPYLP